MQQQNHERETEEVNQREVSNATLVDLLLEEVFILSDVEGQDIDLPHAKEEVQEVVGYKPSKPNQKYT